MKGRRFSLLRQLLWAGTLATGVGTLWAGVSLWLGTEIQEAWRRAAGERPPFEQLVVRSDGTPLIQSTPFPAADLSRETCRDLSGRSQEVPERENLIGGVTAAAANAEPGWFAGELGWDRRLQVFVNEREPNVNWFFVHDGKREGAGYFVAYDRPSKQRIGFIGLDGFHAQPVPPAQWIPVPGDLIRNGSGWSSASIWADSRIRWAGRLDRLDVPPRLVFVPSGKLLRLVDLAARTVTTVFEAPDRIESVGIPTLSNWSGGRSRQEQPILARTNGEIYALDRQHKATRVFTIPAEVDRQRWAQWYDIGNGQTIVVFSVPNPGGQAENVTKEMMYRIAADATITERVELTLKNWSFPRNKQAEACLVAAALPEPAILLLVDLLLAIAMDHTRGGQLVLQALGGSSGLALFVVFALSLVLAIEAWRRSRSFGLPKRDQVAWAGFVLVLGAAGYVGLLLFRRWPIRLPCPSCQAKAPRDRAACAACGNRFPDPPLKGIELFA